MKKLFFISAAFFSFVMLQTAQAAGPYGYDNRGYAYGYNRNYSSGYVKNDFYIGVDGLVSGVHHRYHQIAPGVTGSLPNNYAKEDNGRLGFGFNLGYRATFGDAVYLAPEIFYDNIRSTSQDFYYNDPTYPAPYDKMKVNYRYGAKLNLGYNFSNFANAAGIAGSGFGKFISGLSVFGNAGIAKVSYSYNLPSIQFSGRYPSGASALYPADDSTKVAPIYGFGINYAFNEHVSMKFAADIQQFSARYLDNGLRDSITIKTARVGLAYYF